MKRKGISPLIAAVLLIAFTMAIASIFAQWAPQLIQSAQGDTQNQSQELQRCSTNVLEVDGELSNETQLTVKQTSGDEGVGAISATFFYDGQPVQPSSDYSINDAAGSVQITLTSSDLSEISDPSGSFDKAEVTPTNCDGTAPATYNP